MALLVYENLEYRGDDCNCQGYLGKTGQDCRAEGGIELVIWMYPHFVFQDCRALKHSQGIQKINEFVEFDLEYLQNQIRNDSGILLIFK